jgi:hypothetical protein
VYKKLRKTNNVLSFAIRADYSVTLRPCVGGGAWPPLKEVSCLTIRSLCIESVSDFLLLMSNDSTLFKDIIFFIILFM